MIEVRRYKPNSATATAKPPPMRPSQPHEATQAAKNKNAQTNPPPHRPSSATGERQTQAATDPIRGAVCSVGRCSALEGGGYRWQLQSSFGSSQYSQKRCAGRHRCLRGMPSSHFRQ